MKYQRILVGIFIISCVTFHLLSVRALRTSQTFQLGDSCVPMDENGFIEYDFESSVAASLAKVEMRIIDIYQFGINPPLLVVNISVSKLNPDTNKYEALLVDSIAFNNQTCLSYNKTEQYFRYHQHMENLVTNGFGGFFMVPCDPVDINIVKGYIDAHTTWSASVQETTITIDINNDQAILQYNEQGILIGEEIKSGGQVVSTLSLHENNEPAISFGWSPVLIVVMAIVGLLIIYKRKIYLKRKDDS